jgi:hypothetical protein
MPLFVFLLRLFVLCFARFRSHVFSSFLWLFLFSPACSSLRLLVFCPLVFPSVFSVFFFLPRVPVFFLPLVSSVFFARFSTARES